MNLRLTASAMAAFLLAFAASLPAQTQPPLKMGLWEHQVSVEMSGMPDGMASSHNITRQSCFTADTWRNSLHAMQNHPGMEGVSCNDSNVEQDERHVSFDVQCSMQQGMTTNVHVDMHFDSDEAMHGTTTASMSGPNVPEGMKVTSTIHSKFVNKDCGSVKPDSTTSAGPPPS